METHFVTGKKLSRLVASRFVFCIFLGLPLVSNGQIIFEESFDSQSDYVSSDPLDLSGWSFKRNGEDQWSPSTGFPTKHDAFEILSTNSDKARGETGKSFVAWRESYDPGWKQWNSDGMLLKYLPEGRDQLYVSFYVRFSESWTPSGASKLFRLYSWDENSGTPFDFFADGDAGPIFLWDYAYNDSYGVRNQHAYRGGPHGENYAFLEGDIQGLPRSLVNLGDLSMNFTTDTVGMSVDGSTPKLTDHVWRRWRSIGPFSSCGMRPTTWACQYSSGASPMVCSA